MLSRTHMQTQYCNLLQYFVNHVCEPISYKMSIFAAKNLLSNYSLLSLIEFLSFYLGAESGAHERRLLNDLMANYNKLERPVVNESDAVVLTFGLTLQQIIDVVSDKSFILTFLKYPH